METKTYTAFSGHRMIATGDVKNMLLKTKACLDAGEADSLLIFEDQTGIQVDFDFRGAPEEVIARLDRHPLFANAPVQSEAKSGPGRPHLGVVCREISLLPRHWEWLSTQSGGASATLRRLVDAERKRTAGEDEARAKWETAGKFIWAMAGNLPDFEEASRALYARDLAGFQARTQDWPGDIRSYLERLLA